MRILDAYLGRSIMQTSAFTLMVLVGLSGLIKFIEQLKSVGRGTYDEMDALLYTLYTLPYDVVVFFPMATLIGGLLGLGALASSSELIVMQAAGLSRFQIIRSVMKTAIVLALVMMALGEWAVPEAQKTAKQLRTAEISGGSVFNASQSVWAKDGNTFVNIDEVKESGELSGVALYYFDDNLTLKQITRAESAKPTIDGWQLSTVNNKFITDERIEVTTLEKANYPSQLTPEKLGAVSVKPETLSFQGLYSYLDYLSQNDQDTSHYELAFWRKVMQPISICVMLLVALSFIFGPLRSVTMGARIVMGVVTGIAFHLSEQVFGPIVLVYDLAPFLGATLPILLFLVISLVLLKKRA